MTSNININILHFSSVLVLLRHFIIQISNNTHVLYLIERYCKYYETNNSYGILSMKKLFFSALFPNLPSNVTVIGHRTQLPSIHRALDVQLAYFILL